MAAVTPDLQAARQQDAAALKAAIDWVLNNVSDLALGDIERGTLTEPATRGRFFGWLPELDYEVDGGTLDEPLWAWMTHPWFSTLGLTYEECEAVLTAGGTP
jgi:hypothetical protein